MNNDPNVAPVDVQPVAVVGWQPIATAPKDGTYILVYRARLGIMIAKYDEDSYRRNPQPFWNSHSVFGRGNEKGDPPTHWQPLPKPPTDSDISEQKEDPAL